MYQPISREVYALGVQSAYGTEDLLDVEYWDGGKGFADPQIIIRTPDLVTHGFVLPGLVCEKVTDPTPAPLERIAAALEAIAASLDAIQRNGIPVERVP